MKTLTFDIEISNVLDILPGEDIETYAPFDISVAATKILGGEERLWLSRGPDGTPMTSMRREHAQALLAYLKARQREGHRLVAWNGLSFDLRRIGHAAGDLKAASRVALRLYDPMFQFFKLRGFPIGLAKVAEGMGLSARKLKDGAEAPKQWRAGNHQAVCDYVMGDVRLTGDVVDAVERAGRIAWVTMAGKRSSVAIPELRTVEDCMG